MRPTLLNVQVTTAPATDAVTLAEVKSHLNLDSSFTDDDGYLSDLITSAIRRVEHLSGRSLITQTITADYAAGDLYAFTLPRPPFQSLTSITSRFEGSDTSETASDFYVTRGLVPEVKLKDSGEWVASDIEEVRIVYDAGYGDAAADVPEAARLAVRQAVADWYEHRMGTALGTVATRDLPGSAKRTLRDAGLIIPRV